MLNTAKNKLNDLDIDIASPEQENQFLLQQISEAQGNKKGL